MLRKIVIAIVACSALLPLFFAAGCETGGQTGALVGTAAGAGIGQLAGGDTKGTLIGAGIGAVGGYIVGDQMEKSKERKQQASSGQQYSEPSAQDTITVWVTNSNNSQTPVRLTHNSDGSYTGPKGEHYTTMPSQERLKGAYGF